MAERGGRDEAIRDVRGRRERLRQCMDELEAVIAAPAPGREKDWIRSLSASLAALADAFERHVTDTEASDGFLQQVAADAPRLHHAVQRLREDHSEIGALVEGLRGRIGDATPADLRTDVLDLLGRLARHRHLGADLVYEAYQVDIGAAD